MDFMNAPMPGTGYYQQQQSMPYGYINNNNYYQQQQTELEAKQKLVEEYKARMAALETPQIVTNTSDGNGLGFKFTITDDPNSNSIPVENESDVSKRKKKLGDKKTEIGSNAIVRADGIEHPVAETLTVENTPTSYSYYETGGLLRETLGQIDAVNRELMQEFQAVKQSRTMKGKYQVLNGLAENVNSMISNRISVIKELNNSIKQSNELDYKKFKDNRAASAAVDDDKYIADLYKAFMANPANAIQQPNIPHIDPAMCGSGIIRAELVNGNGVQDESYLRYISNLTPEQNLMYYENNPNVKEVVVFDAASGNKFFQMMDMSTGNVIPNVPTLDPMFMEDTTIDLATKTAKNLNLNKVFPVVVINEGVTSQY